MYSHSGATLSKMLECLVNFIAKCKLSEFAIGFCHSKKMYNVTIFFGDLTNVRSKLLLLGHFPNLVADIVRCPTVICSPECCCTTCSQPVNKLSKALLTTCCKVVELNRLVTNCFKNLLSSCNSTVICQQVVSDNLVAT